MDALPYEILQLISNNLLPRYQCRLAMASKYHYLYLYNDLMRWHAKWRQVAPPKYKYLPQIDECAYYISLIEFNKQLVIYEHLNDSSLVVNNFTTLYKTSLEGGYNRDKISTEELVEIYYAIKDTNILSGCYKYMNRLPFIVCYNGKHLLLSMPQEILEKIMHMLSWEDLCMFLKASGYLSCIYTTG